MSDGPVLTIYAVPHRDARVRRIGVGLDHAYLEQCWTPILGPSSVLLLRRLPVLWQTADPIEIPMQELSRSIGLGHGTEAASPIQRTFDRLQRFGFCRQSVGGQVAVPTAVGPLSERQLERVPEWCRQQHDELWGRHLDALATGDPTQTIPDPHLAPALPVIESPSAPALSDR